MPRTHPPYASEYRPGDRENFVIEKIYTPPAVAGRVPVHDCRSRRLARPKRRYADGLVPRTACREGPQLPDRRVHVQAGRLPRRQRDGAQREGRAQGHRWRVRTSGRPRTSCAPKIVGVHASLITRSFLVGNKKTGETKTCHFSWCAAALPTPASKPR